MFGILLAKQTGYEIDKEKVNRYIKFSDEIMEHMAETYYVKEMVRIYDGESSTWLFSMGNRAVNANALWQRDFEQNMNDS